MMRQRVRKNEPGSFLTHFVGFGLAIAALVILVVVGVQEGNAWHVTSYAIFGSSLVLLYSISSIYHMISRRKKRVKAVFRILDHSMIYVVIAGSYTPINLVALNGAWGWTLFGLTWGIAVLGILMKIIYRNKINSWILSIPYVIMGWIGLIAVLEIFHVFSLLALYWLFIGGVFYTIGTVFFILGKYRPYPKWFGFHEVFHLFVIAGSFSHFWLMYRYISQI